jgi:hypothetical protein
MHDELNETSISSQADEMPSQPTASYTTRWDSTCNSSVNSKLASFDWLYAAHAR